ncbi:sigma-70 family RNA polymerase sigma factor [Ammoniphilus oxalaticus]|uniref:sigma-70 family RNA polymerase sigma factor n=1 Tax=Ammoniphilus oxalaticus TaxID=66863 RepID=UPI001FE62BBA|nr:sigma-70 family RNA polymerase sigma factor [Ammoniphilus oxalaticus]
MDWADRLIREYSDGRKELKRQADQLDRDNPNNADDLTLINGMIENMNFSLEWLETGRQPGLRRGVDKSRIYQRQYFESMDLIPDITDQIDDINEKELYMTREEKIILADIFASFSHRERQCYILHVGQRMSMGKIADEIGVSKGTVQGYIKRAEKKIKERIS